MTKCGIPPPAPNARLIKCTVCHHEWQYWRCPHDPKELAGSPIGMYHCPLCSQMVIAALEHPDYSMDCDWCGAPGEDIH